jgi:hypothetical protein
MYIPNEIKTLRENEHINKKDLPFCHNQVHKILNLIVN